MIKSLDIGKKRNSSIELLRIIAIELIVAWHYCTQFNSTGGGAILTTNLSLYHIFAIVFGTWGQLGVDLFIIISAYYLEKKNSFRTLKVFDLILETIFYAIMWIIICSKVLGMSFTVSGIINQLFSIVTGSNWFITAYLLLYIFHPVLNSIKKSLSERQLKKLTGLMLIFVCIYKFVYSDAPISDFAFFVFVYFLVCCFEQERFSAFLEKNAKKGALICTVGLILVNIFIVAVSDYFGLNFLLERSYFLMRRCSVFVLMDAVFIFYLFIKMKPFSYSLVNIFASTSLGVYLGHQGISILFWRHILEKNITNQILACIYMLICVQIILISISVVDILRQMAERILNINVLKNEWLSKSIDKIDRMMNEL